LTKFYKKWKIWAELPLKIKIFFWFPPSINIYNFLQQQKINYSTINFFFSFPLIVLEFSTKIKTDKSVTRKSTLLAQNSIQSSGASRFLKQLLVSVTITTARAYSDGCRVLFHFGLEHSDTSWIGIRKKILMYHNCHQMNEHTTRWRTHEMAHWIQLFFSSVFFEEEITLINNRSFFFKLLPFFVIKAVKTR